jgi:hypothetical protein
LARTTDIGVRTRGFAWARKAVVDPPLVVTVVVSDSSSVTVLENMDEVRAAA